MKTTMKAKAKRIIIIALMLAVSYTAFAASQAPDFTAYDAQGNAVKLSDYKGKPIVLNFWASWCPPCKAEMPHFAEAVKQHQDVAFLFVNMTDGFRETVNSAAAYLKSNKYDFTSLFDTKQEAAVAYSVTSLPTTYFINSSGELIAGVRGGINAATLEKGISMIRK